MKLRFMEDGDELEMMTVGKAKVMVGFANSHSKDPPEFWQTTPSLLFVGDGDKAISLGKIKQCTHQQDWSFWWRI